MRFVTIGYTAEGPTDERFLGGLITRVFLQIALECSEVVDISEPRYFPRKGAFEEGVLSVAKEAENNGIMILCVHTDADGPSADKAMQYKIAPALKAISSCAEPCCKNIVVAVPVYMTEAWMLADIQALRKNIGRDISIEVEDPEHIPDPKQHLMKMISDAYKGMARRRRQRQTRIGDLYQPLGAEIDLNHLAQLPSYQLFLNEARESFRRIGLLKDPPI